ncbi:MAG TPA: PDZ domain-containing protein, partial [Azonexus sp.]|nr:PDZ domain-containing protein [Azonexus sp.]
PPRLGVALEDKEGTVRVQSITAGSLAERSGFVVGDRLIEVAGKPALNTSTVISAIRRQPPGTWLPLRVQRGETALDLVVRFPAKT